MFVPLVTFKPLIMRNKTFFSLLLVGFLLVSCESYRVTPLSGPTYPPTNPESVEIFISDIPTREYMEIGTVSVRTIVSHVLIATTRSPEKANQLMKEQAASIGGNAVINYREEEQQIKGTVIRYK